MARVGQIKKIAPTDHIFLLSSFLFPYHNPNYVGPISTKCVFRKNKQRINLNRINRKLYLLESSEYPYLFSFHPVGENV